jgi:hypothetical protein
VQLSLLEIDMYWRGNVLENNTRRYMRRKERKTEQWEDKSPYIHRSPYPTSILKFLLPTSLSSILHSSNRIFLH